MNTFFTGGLLRGHRTYLLGSMIALQAIVGWAVGELTFVELVDKLPEILGGLGLITLRAGVESERT